MDRCAIAGWLAICALSAAGCTKSPNETSYELVEKPKAKSSHEAQKPAAEAVRDLMPAVDTTKLSPVPSGTEVANAVKAAAAESLQKPTGADLAMLTARDANGKLPVPPEPLTPSPASLAEVIPNKIELKVPERHFDKDRERSLRVTYDDLDLLKVLNMEPVPLDAEKYLPDWLTGLDKKKVRLKGWMFPPPSTDGLPNFLFVRDNQICCFGREAKVYDKVRVTLKEGTTTEYIFGRPFDVVGTFHIAPEERDGQLYFLYSIDDAVVMK